MDLANQVIVILNDTNLAALLSKLPDTRLKLVPPVLADESAWKSNPVELVLHNESMCLLFSGHHALYADGVVGRPGHIGELYHKYGLDSDAIVKSIESRL